MEDNITGKVKLPPVAHVGMVVKDIDAVIEFYSSTFGIGPWRRGQREYTGLTVRGKNYPAKTRAAWASLGPITLELFELREGRTLHSEFLDKGREGLHHLGFSVSREEKEQIIAELDKLGIGVAQSFQTESGGHAFLDTEKMGGVFFELVQVPPQE